VPQELGGAVAGPGSGEGQRAGLLTLKAGVGATLGSCARRNEEAAAAKSCCPVSHRLARLNLRPPRQLRAGPVVRAALGPGGGCCISGD